MRIRHAFILLFAAHTLRAQVPSASAGPPAAYSVGAAYDSARARLVVFGGFASGGYIGDTWEWDGTSWRRFAGAGPSARNGPLLVYDAARRNIVMFGGDTRATGPLGDTWTFDGARWTQAATSGPAPRSGHAMVYDSRRQRVVLFGGYDGTAMRGDTWEWDGQRWTQVATDGPAARALFGLAYDGARGKTVLFGGTSLFAPDAPSHGDTWEWDGRRWTQSSVTGPGARDHVAMGFDAARGAVIVHGGGMESAAQETWAFDGRAWNRISTAGPRRRYSQLAFDSRTKSMLLYGGFDMQPSNELWRFDGTRWARIAPPVLVDSIRDRLRVRSPRVEEVTIIEVRYDDARDPRRVVVARGVPRDHQFRGSLDDELFGVFVANDSLTRLIRTIDLLPSQRWFDFDVRVDRITRDSVFVRGKGSTYGDQPLVRRYAW